MSDFGQLNLDHTKITGISAIPEPQFWQNEDSKYFDGFGKAL